MLPVTIGRRTAMSNFRLLGAVVILSTAIATPVLAQQVIQEPGYCAQFYPNANCQNKGPNNPYTGSYQRNLEQSNGMWTGDQYGMWTGDQTVGSTTRRSRTHRYDPTMRRMQ
jgi:hypothetical protein